MLVLGPPQLEAQSYTNNVDESIGLALVFIIFCFVPTNLLIAIYNANQRPMSSFLCFQSQKFETKLLKLASYLSLLHRIKKINISPQS